MATARKTAEPPAEEIGDEEPGGSGDGLTKDDVRGLIREELSAFFGELEAPGPEEAGVPEAKLDEPKTQREVENQAWESVKRALQVIPPLLKEPEKQTAPPETSPKVGKKITDWMWGKA